MDDYLMLSGIQHFAFCRRRWALIHIEGQWSDNFYTVDGKILHENAHDPFFAEKRGERIISRAVPVRSAELRMSGECDVVEFIAHPKGVALNGRSGLWLPRPVEYKRGRGGSSDADSIQLCAQAMCLEEMLCCPRINKAYIYYGELRRRVEVELGDELREQIKRYAVEMHEMFRRGYTPKVKKSSKCALCSLREICLPSLDKKASAKEYVERSLSGEG